MKKFSTILGLILCTNLVLGTTLEPEKAICPDSTISWFDTTDKFVVACFGDGRIGCWKISDGKLISSGKIKDYSYTPSPQLALSKGTSNMLVVLDERDYWEGEDLYQSMTVYELPEFKISRTLRIKNMIGAYFCGITLDGNVVMNSFHSSAVSAYNLTTGKKTWRIEIDDHAPRGTAVSSDGAIIVRCDGQVITARSPKGVILWEKQNPKGVTLETPYTSGSGDHARSLFVFWRDTIESATEKQAFVAISPKDGQTSWERPGEYTELLQVSIDGKKQAFQLGGKVNISSLPRKTIVHVPAIAEEVDARFTTSGKRVLFLPALKTVKRNSEANTYTVGRTSDTMRVIDSSTGKEIYSFSLSLNTRETSNKSLKATDKPAP